MTGSSPFPLLATFFYILALAILCALGFWQLERLAWKEQIISSIQAQKDIPADHTLLSLSEIESAAGEPYPYLRGSVKGKYEGKPKSVFIHPRTNESGEVGAHLIQAFNLEGKAAHVIVNRGWVPEKDARFIESPKQEGRKVTGHFKKISRSAFISSSNIPEQNIWTRVDVEQLKTHWGLEKVAPLVLYKEKAGRESSGYPTGFSKNWQPRDKHMQYAFFWFSMAGVLTLIYILRFILPYMRNRSS